MTEQIIVLAAYCICIAFFFGAGIVIVNLLIAIGGLLVIVWEFIKSYLEYYS